METFFSPKCASLSRFGFISFCWSVRFVETLFIKTAEMEIQRWSDGGRGGTLVACRKAQIRGAQRNSARSSTEAATGPVATAPTPSLDDTFKGG